MKVPKIYSNGRRDYKAERDYEGKFTSRFRKFKKFCNGCMWVAIIGLVGYVIFLYGGYAQPRAVAVENIVEVDNLTPKIQELKDRLVEDIRNCERAGHSENDAPIILDTNNKMSIGTFMFQKSTVQYYYKTLYGKTITGKEATLIALDEPKARELAYDIIFKDSKGVNNWWNCSNKINAKGRLAVINELSK